MKPRVVYVTTAGREERPMSEDQLARALSLENENAAMRAINQLITEMLIEASADAATPHTSQGTHEGGRLDALFGLRTKIENLRRTGTREGIANARPKAARSRNPYKEGAAQ